MLFKQMKYFVAVVNCNSFTEAAEECYISQSAISQQIKALEDEIGVELIHRENRRFTVTDAGRYFYQKSLLIIDQAERLKQETAKIGGNDGNVLNIGYLKTYGRDQLQETLADFAKKYPDISINVSAGTHEELYELMKGGGSNLLFSDQRRVFSPEANNFPVTTAYRYIEVSSQSSLAGLEAVNVEDLQQIPCILVASKEQQAVEREYHKTYLGFGSEYLFAENLDVARLMAAAGRGFVIVEGSKSMEPVGNAVKRIPLYKDGVQMTHDYFAYWMKDNGAEYIEDFAKMLRDTFERQQ